MAGAIACEGAELSRVRLPKCARVVGAVQARATRREWREGSRGRHNRSHCNADHDTAGPDAGVSAEAVLMCSVRCWLCGRGAVVVLCCAVRAPRPESCASSPASELATSGCSRPWADGAGCNPGATRAPQGQEQELNRHLQHALCRAPKGQGDNTNPGETSRQCAVRSTVTRATGTKNRNPGA